MDEYIYCAVNSQGEIQQVCGSSKRTYYFRTPKYLKGAIEYHNKYREEKWRLVKFKLVEVPIDE